MKEFLSLVVPLYNEAGNVADVARGLVEALRRGAVPFELILVDNGSTDGTGAAIDHLQASIPEIVKAVVPVNLGYGWGVLRGLEAAGGDVVGFMGGDGQIDPADVVRVYRLLEEPGVDLAKVRRVRRQDGLARLAVTVAANVLFRLGFGLRTWDVNGTPKMMRRSLYEQLRPRSKDWFLDAEVMIGCARRGVAFAEVPVSFRRRVRGASKVRWVTLVEFLRNVGAAWMEPAR